MMSRNNLVKLADVYVESVKRQHGIYTALTKFDIYVDVEYNPYDHFAEEIFNEVDSCLVDELLDLAHDGYTEVYVNGKKLKLDSTKDIIDICLGD